jgi:2,3-bisphosphoglycerate-independent phosphoglycerate mutase
MEKMEKNEILDNPDLTPKPKLVFLLLLEGWGIAEKNEANAISSAHIPNFSKMAKEYPAAILEANALNINARYLILGTGLAVSDETQAVGNDLSSIISDAGLKQLKIFDSERLAALTSFFNGRREDRLIGEDWLSVSLEDNKQEINVRLALKRIFRESIKAVKSKQYNFIIAACSALDIAAASGDFDETVKTAEALDKALKSLAAEVIDHQGILVISSSAGNAERLKDMATDLPDKNMTDNPVPLIIAGHDFKGKTIGLKDAPDGDLSLLEPAGSLSDITPTILDLMGLSKDNQMSGISLIN